MDPFTQRMLERAKIRREKLDNHLSQKIELEQKAPLQETNTVTNEEFVNKLCETEKVSSTQSKKHHLADIRKSKLKKLALFYSGKTEKSLLSDDDDDDEEENEKRVATAAKNVNAKQQCKLGRLTELAMKINEWEDDVNHPRHNMKTTHKHCEDNVLSENSKKFENNGKKIVWDSNLVEDLCSQGFSLSENHSRLIYDFDNNKENTTDLKISSATSKNTETNKCSSPASDKVCSPLKSYNTGKSVNTQNEVLKKAALFESGNADEPYRRVKDPAELSLAERKALFERNNDVKIELKKPGGVLHIDRSKGNQKVLAKVANLEKLICDGKSEIVTNETHENDGGNLEDHEFYSKDEHQSNEQVKREKVFIPENQSRMQENDDSDRNREGISEGKVPNPPPMPQSGRNNGVSVIAEKDLGDTEVINGGTKRLYPSLSNLELSYESEFNCSGIESSNESKGTNFYLNMTLTDLLEMNKNNPVTPPNELSFSKSKEYQVLNKMDKLLENALNDVSSDNEDGLEDVPSPPKMMKSSSFEYKSNNENSNALLHTISFYRKQQNNFSLTPEKVTNDRENIVERTMDESLLVQNKIQSLLSEVNKQQTIISQASQALNLCLSTVEFSGSGEQVEGERLLLLASHKRQACLNEIQRLRIENTLRPLGQNLLTEKGDVNLTNISVKLKRDALRAMAAAENLQYFVCLIKSDEQVLATPVVSATRENLKDLAVEFPGQIKLEGLLSDFKVTVEVYNLELNKELLPHDVKYHINNKKEKKLLTPIKSKKSESKLVKLQVQSPAGPNAVRTSNFQMCGYIVFSLREISRTQWILNKVPYISPVEGSISMNIQSQLHLDDEFRGFLTMFDDISGFGAWHRRWCLLSSHVISYWKYPDDEHKKVPIGTIDLRSVVTENVGSVSRDICARLHTFLLETTRPRLSDDKNSLVLNVRDKFTTIRHLLSADSKLEMQEWCKKLNTTLALLRSWKCNFDE